MSGPNSQVKEQLVLLSFDASLAGTSLATIAVTDRVAEQLLKPSGKTLKELQDQLDTGQPLMGMLIPETAVSATIMIQQEKKTGRNVIARLPGALTEGNPALMIGAHIDHLGHGDGTSSLAREDEKGQIHYGADDNASGVAGLLEIAQYLAALQAKEQLRLRRNILFAAWSGEEMGLLGSSYFTRTFGGEPQSGPLCGPPSRIPQYGHDRATGKNLIVQGIRSSSAWLGL